MKEYDRVVLMVNKSEYMKDGLYMGMDGWICEPVKEESDEIIVNFDLYGPLPDIYDYKGVNKEDVRLQDVSELKERALCIGAIYFSDYYNSDEYKKDYGILIEEIEEFGKQDVHFGAYGQILSSVENDVITVRFDLKYPEPKSVTLDVPREYLEYCGKPDLVYSIDNYTKKRD